MFVFYKFLTRFVLMKSRINSTKRSNILASPAATAVHQNITGNLYKSVPPSDAHLIQTGPQSSSSTGTSENDETELDKQSTSHNTKTLTKFSRNRQLSFHVQEAARNGYYNREEVQYKSKLQNFINRRNMPEDQLQVPYGAL